MPLNEKCLDKIWCQGSQSGLTIFRGLINKWMDGLLVGLFLQLVLHYIVLGLLLPVTISASLHSAEMVATCDKKCFKALSYNPVLPSWQVAAPGHDGSGAFDSGLCPHCPYTLNFRPVLSWKAFQTFGFKTEVWDLTVQTTLLLFHCLFHTVPGSL